VVLRRITVGRRLTAGFTLLIVALIAAAAVGLWKMGDMRDRATFMGTEVVPSLQTLGHLNTTVAAYRTGQYREILSTTPAESAETEKLLKDRAASIEKDLSTYGSGMVADATDQRFLDDATKKWKAYQAATDSTTSLAAAGRMKAATAVVKGKKAVYDDLDGHVQKWVAYNQTLSDRQVDATRSAYSQAMVILVGFVLIAIAAAVVMALAITRSIVRPLAGLRERLGAVADGDLTARVDEDGRDELSSVATAFNGFAERMQGIVRRVTEGARNQVEIADEMARGAEQAGQAVAQIAATVDEVAKGSSEQAEQTARVSGTMAEMGEGVTRVAQSGQTAASVASEADEAASEGARRVEEAQGAMGSIERRVEEAAGMVVTLGERSSQVGQIVDTISDIAAQTNLLALNAAIEAARAGELGRGFAVVADEVRQLAESTQEQVGSISGIVNDIREQTDLAVQAMEAGRAEVQVGVGRVSDAGEAFGRIRERVERVSTEVESVAAAAEQLEAGAVEVRESMTAVAAVSEENAASVQEVSASTEETSASTQQTSASAQQVAASARELAEMVSVFRV
jgi:methyl-accepting chemotaxis protein